MIKNADQTRLIRKVDALGRIALPIELRRYFCLRKDDPLEIFIEDETIVLKIYRPGCIFCGESLYVKRLKGVLVCSECLSEINNKLL